MSEGNNDTCKKTPKLFNWQSSYDYWYLKRHRDLLVQLYYANGATVVPIIRTEQMSIDKKDD